MSRKKQHQNLYIYMNGIRVGTLIRETHGVLSFTYDAKWLTSKETRPISLSLPLRELPYKGELVERFFDNLLPDNELIRKRIQTRFNIPSNNCFDLLSHIGADCVGALQLLNQTKVVNIKTINATPISNSAIATLLKHYQTAPLGMDRELDFRISIAGAQEKTALLRDQGKWYLPQGATPTSHIIKLPIGYIKHTGIDLSESVENEWLCLKILAEYNLPVNDAKIVSFADVKTLVVERFDRRWASDKKWLIRLPQEDLCQALGVAPALKYESDGGPGIKDIMNLLLGSQKANQDREQFMKTVFLFWVMGAIDGHAKNFSVFIESQGRYQLTPIYDVMSAYPIAAKRQLEWRKLKMAMSLRGKTQHYLWSNLQIRHWLAMAEQCQFPVSRMQALIEEIFDRMDEVILKVTKMLPAKFPAHISDAIFLGMQQVRDHCDQT